VIYQRGEGWEIHQGESEDLLPRLIPGGRIHFVTDPPYGIGLEYGERVDSWRPDWEYWKLLFDLCDEASTLHMTVSNKHLPFWIRETTDAGWQYLHTSVYWNYGRAGGNANGQFAYAWEPMLSFSKTGTITLGKRMLSDVFRHKGRRTTDHPAERDLGVWRAFMAHLPPGLIVDPFLGSGTTLRAAIDLGRPALGIEREPEWCRQAALRCSQLSLFAGDLSNPAPEPETLMEGSEP
jgi:hypothetical protein